jgi:putative flippase GtrA
VSVSRSGERFSAEAGHGIRTQSLRFLVVGLGTLLLDYACYRGLLSVGVEISPAKAAGFVVGTTAAYLVNRAWTFRSRGGAAAVASFVVLYAVTLALNVAVNAGLVGALEGTAYRIEAAFLAAQAVTSLANFLGLRYVVFRRGR